MAELQWKQCTTASVSDFYQSYQVGRDLRIGRLHLTWIPNRISIMIRIRIKSQIESAIFI